MKPVFISTLALAVLASGCRAPQKAEPKSETELTSAVLPKEDEGAVRVNEVKVPNDLPAYRVAGAKDQRLTMAFLAGMCAHPAGYVEAFRNAAAERGNLVTVQGDAPCGTDGLRSWSTDLGKLDKRIMAAFEAAGLGQPTEIALIGYSQGAERAERLVARWPDKYTRAVLIASPVNPNAPTFKQSKAVVMMAGTHDAAKPAMEKAATRFESERIKSTFVELSDAEHGAMGSAPEKQMDRALDFLEGK